MHIYIIIYPYIILPFPLPMGPESSTSCCRVSFSSADMASPASCSGSSARKRLLLAWTPGGLMSSGSARFTCLCGVAGGRGAEKREEGSHQTYSSLEPKHLNLSGPMMKSLKGIGDFRLN